MALNNQKYVVSKRTDDDFGRGLEKLDPDEYFVIRRGDILGISMLRSYQQNVLMLLDLDDLHSSMTEEQRAYLFDLARDVDDLAHKWDAGGTVRKIPD